MTIYKCDYAPQLSQKFERIQGMCHMFRGRDPTAFTLARGYGTPLYWQEAFEKCWGHSPLRAAARRIAIHQVSLLSHAATVARRLRIDVHNNDDDDDNNDNAWQRGPLWPHRMGPMKCAFRQIRWLMPYAMGCDEEP